MARKRTEKNGATVITDPDRTLAQKWGLGDCNNQFVLMIVSKEGELVLHEEGRALEGRSGGVLRGGQESTVRQR